MSSRLSFSWTGINSGTKSGAATRSGTEVVVSFSLLINTALPASVVQLD